MIDTNLVDNVEWENFDMSDYPDFCDAYIVGADIEDSGTVRECTDIELEELNEHPTHEEWRSREKYGTGGGAESFMEHAYVHPNDPGDIHQSDFI